MKRYKTANRIFLASAILLGIAMGVRYFYKIFGRAFTSLPSPVSSAVLPTGLP
ncbi:MAG: hypothetical protein ACLUIQ_06525 [Dialister invisus]